MSGSKSGTTSAYFLDLVNGLEPADYFCGEVGREARKANRAQRCGGVIWT